MKKKTRNSLIAIGVATFLAGNYVWINETWFISMPCDILEPHMHEYQDNIHRKRYIDSHNKTIGIFSNTFRWTKNWGLLSYEMRDASSEEFFPVAINVEYLNKIIDANQDYIEYYCTFEHWEKVGTKTVLRPRADGDGGVSVVSEEVDVMGWAKKSSWTKGIIREWSDKYQGVSYNGDARYVSHLYTMYNWVDNRGDGIPHFTLDNQVNEEDVFEHNYFKNNLVREVRGPIYQEDLEYNTHSLVIK